MTELIKNSKVTKLSIQLPLNAKVIFFKVQKIKNKFNLNKLEPLWPPVVL